LDAAIKLSKGNHYPDESFKIEPYNRVFFMCSMMLLSVSHAELLTDEKWSFGFNNIPIADAFNEIKTKTGIDIVLCQKSNQPVMITYCSKDQSIFQIQKDLLRNVNHTSSWNYANDGRLKSINIVILGRGDRNDKIPVSNSINQADRKVDEQKSQRTKLEKPPEAPKMIGLRSPPMPPQGFKFSGVLHFAGLSPVF